MTGVTVKRFDIRSTLTPRTEPTTETDLSSKITISVLSVLSVRNSETSLQLKSYSE